MKMNTMERKYVRTWADYLTPCPHFKNIFIGDYSCSRCLHFISSSEESQRYSKISDEDYYARYFKLISGSVKCNKAS